MTSLTLYLALAFSWSLIIGAVMYISSDFSIKEILLNKYMSWRTQEQEARATSDEIVCPECGKGPMQKQNDLEEHVKAKHTNSINKKEDSCKETVSSINNDVKKTGEIKKELGIGYDDPEWLDDEEDDEDFPDIQPSSDRVSKAEQVENKWSKLLNKLERNGEVKVHDHSHYGSIRGDDIIECFKSDFKRMDKNYSIDTEYIADSGSDYGCIRKAS